MRSTELGAQFRLGLVLLVGGLGMAMFASRLHHIGEPVPPLFSIVAFSFAAVGFALVVTRALEARSTRSGTEKP